MLPVQLHIQPGSASLKFHWQDQQYHPTTYPMNYSTYPIACTMSCQVQAQSQHIQLPIQYYNKSNEYSSMLQNSVFLNTFSYGTHPGASLHSLHLHCCHLQCILSFKQIVFLRLRPVFAISTTSSSFHRPFPVVVTLCHPCIWRRKIFFVSF